MKIIKGCGKWLKESDDYGFIVCGDVLELKSGKESKPKLCKECRCREIDEAKT